MTRPKRRPKKPATKAKPTAGRPARKPGSPLARAQEAVRRRDYVTAETLAEKVLRASPRDPGAAEVLARVHAARGRFDLAMRRLEPLTAAHGDHYALMRLFAHYVRRAGFHERAAAIYEQLRQRRPDDVEVLEGLGTSLVMSGERDRVRALLEPVLQGGGATPAMRVTHVRAILDGHENELAVKTAQEHLEHPDLRETHKRRLHALRGKGLERLGRFDEAFAAYRRAAEHERVPFDREGFRAEIDALIGFFTADRFAACARSALATDEVVFVVGMPRSGSTLIERILDAHPRAHAIGEHPAMFGVTERVKADFRLDGPWPQRVASLTGEALTRLGQTYLDAVRQGLSASTGGIERIIDKALWNTHSLGLIAMLLPNARVIWSRRNPEDSCISCFAESFEPHHSPYASDLANLGFVHRETDRLMRHWQEVLPVPVLAVQYEEVVADQASASRELVDFVGLPWHDDCLQFHRKAAQATTLSHEQVRRPIYGSSVGRAARFAQHLGPLREALGV